MARNALYRFCFLTVTAGMLPGASTITGPVAGYAVASSGPELRAIFGVPGSYRFSDPLPLPDGVTRIHITPGQDFALVERGDAGLGILFLSGGTVDRVAAVDGAMATADWVAFSPRARSAILFSSSAHRLQVLSGLPDGPRLVMDLDATNLPERPVVGGLSDDSQVLLVASRRAVYRIPPDGATQLLLSAEEIVSLAILRNGTDAVVAERRTGPVLGTRHPGRDTREDLAVKERGTGSVHLLQNITSTPTTRELASGWEGIGELYPSSDGGTIFVARPGAKAVSSIDVPSGEVQSLDSDVLPISLQPLRNRDTFLISAEPHQPGWIFYRDANAGRVVFIPAVKVSEVER